MPGLESLLPERRQLSAAAHPRTATARPFRLVPGLKDGLLGGSMPLYAYAPLKSPCRLCGLGFEHRQSATTPPLTTCPTCGQPVLRAEIHAVNSPQLSAPLSVSRAKQAGFTFLARTSDGAYEKR